MYASEKVEPEESGRANKELAIKVKNYNRPGTSINNPLAFNEGNNSDPDERRSGTHGCLRCFGAFSSILLVVTSNRH